MSGTLNVERVLAAPPSRVWEIMTEPGVAGRWMDAQGFRPEVGHRFTARLPRGPGFDGIVQAEVLELDPPRSIRMWWSGGPVSGEVRIALSPTAAGGTRVTIEQTGFDRVRQGTLAPALALLWGQRIDGPLSKAIGLGAAGGTVLGMASILQILAVTGGVAAVVGLLVALVGYLVAPQVSVSQPAPPPAVAQPSFVPRNTSLDATPPTPDEVTVTTALPNAVDRMDLPVQTAVRPGPGRLPTGGVELTAYELDGDAYDPTFSHDGRFLAVRAVDNETSAVVFVDRQSGKVEQVALPGTGGTPYAAGTSAIGRLAWHPQGLAVFGAQQPDAPARLYFAQPHAAGAAEMLPRSQIEGAIFDPEISPDGQVLAFTRGGTDDQDVLVWDRRTDKRMLVTVSVALEHTPTFSPTGVDLALVIEHARGSSIQVVNLRTRQERTLPLPDGSQRVQSPVYAGPDRILAYSKADGRWDLVIYEDEVPKQIVRNVSPPALHRQPAVSPDRTVMAWTSAEGRDDVVMLATVDLPHRTIPVRMPGLAVVRDPALFQDDDALYVAFTAIDAYGERTLYVARVPW